MSFPTFRRHVIGIAMDALAVKHGIELTRNRSAQVVYERSLVDRGLTTEGFTEFSTRAVHKAIMDVALFFGFDTEMKAYAVGKSEEDLYDALVKAVALKLRDDQQVSKRSALFTVGGSAVYY